MDTHILHLQMPQDTGELCNSMKHIVDLFYDRNYNGKQPPLPMVLPFRYLLKKDGPLQALCHTLAHDWGVATVRVAKVMVGSFGVAAWLREHKWMSTQVKSKEEVTREWTDKNVAALSFMTIASEQYRLGLGCNCALCCAVYIGSNFDPEKKNTIECLYEELKAIEECDDAKCASTAIDYLAKRYHWQEPVSQWGFQNEGRRRIQWTQLNS